MASHVLVGCGGESGVALVRLRSVDYEPLANRSSALDAGVFGMANGCYTAMSTATGQYVTARYLLGYKYRADGTESEAARFFLKPTGLGTFILFDENRDMLVADGGPNVGRWHEVSDKAEWLLARVDDDLLGLKSVKEQKWLGVTQDAMGAHLRVWESFSKEDAFVFAAAEGCTPYPESEVNVDVVVAKRASDDPVWGVADVHTHLFSNEGFGGLLFQGKAFDRLGLPKALEDCSYAHGAGGVLDNIGNAVDERMGHYTDGYPGFTGWPRFDLSNHQQVYYKWLKRAYLGGLRLIVTHAVTNVVLCDLAKKKDGYTCDEMETVDRQLAKVKEMEAYIDAQNGGPGTGWFRIVYGPAEARSVINSGKLAVVLGIEVDTVFECTTTDCSPDALAEQLDRYHDKGVRSVFPVHMFDNGAGGPSLQLTTMQNMGNKFVNDEYLDLYDCSSLGYEFVEPNDVPALWSGLLGENYSPHEEAKGHCNAKGMTPAGAAFLREMMKRGMIIEIDHMSGVMIDQALAVAEAHSYPVMSGHTGFAELSSGQHKHEGQKTAEQIARIKELGGIIAPIFNQGHPKDYGESVENDCDGSSKSWAQSYQYLLGELQGGPDPIGIPIGSDINGMIQQPAPRFGSDACRGNTKQASAQVDPVTYPFLSHGEQGVVERQKTMDRVWDYNQDGFAHYGLLPDFIQDLKNIGLTDDQLAPLFRSAETYLQMWEKVEAAGL
jgi:microsomal dipeptidase-like Zn-dependent dipeptidase